MFRSSLISLVLLALPAMAAQPVTYCDLCAGYTVSRKGDDVLIRCPGAPRDQPWMTIKDCKNPRMTQRPDRVTITCDFGATK